MNGVVKSVGTRTGPDAGNLLILDIDGASARAFCKQRNCSEKLRSGWIIRRSNAPDRFKVAFRIDDSELEERLDGVGKIVLNTGTDPLEQIELFWGKGQCIAWVTTSQAGSTSGKDLRKTSEHHRRRGFG